MDYDKAYQQVPDYFGPETEAFFQEHANLLAPDSLVLDIGAGQGRHSLFLARRGIRVQAIDPSRAAVATLCDLAKRERLPLTCFRASFEEFTPDGPAYDGVLLFGILQEQPWQGIHLLLNRIQGWTRSGSLLFVTAFTSRDPACLSAQENGWINLGENSFQTPSGDVRTYLKPGQLKSLLPGFEAVHFWEGRGPVHRHGDGPPERHDRIHAVLRKV